MGWGGERGKTQVSVVRDKSAFKPQDGGSGQPSEPRAGSWRLRASAVQFLFGFETRPVLSLDLTKKFHRSETDRLDKFFAFWGEKFCQADRFHFCGTFCQIELKTGLVSNPKRNWTAEARNLQLPVRGSEGDPLPPVLGFESGFVPNPV